MAKSDRIVTRLESEMRVKLHAKASAIGLDDAAYVRMLIYRDLNGVEALQRPAQVDSRFVRPTSSAEQEHDPDFDEQGGWIGKGPDPRQPGEEPEPLLVEEMDIPADPDDGALGELLAAGPSLLDEMVARTAANPAAHATPARHAQSRSLTTRTYRAPLSRSQGMQLAYGPGSRTRAVGVNDQAVGFMGDSPNSVLRTNMGHFGIGAATRAR